MAWVVLVIAGLLEVVWAGALKASEGFSRPGATALFVAALAGSMLLLAQAARTLPLGTAYAVWVGIGALGAAIVGVTWFGEAMTLGKGVSLALLVAGIVGLKLTSEG